MTGPPARHLAVVGPTASGKSALATELALVVGTERDDAPVEGVELLSADSMAVYRGMDIGTTTPTPSEQARVRHHLVDLVEPDEEFSVVGYQQAAAAVLDEVEGRGAQAILVGGTGLYVSAVVDDLRPPGRFPDVRAELEAQHDTSVLYEQLVSLDPVAAGRIEPGNRRRVLRALEVCIGSGRPFSAHGPGLGAHPPSPFVLVGLHVARDQLEPRIRRRLQRQLDDGWLEEVAALQQRPGGCSRTASQALGYRELGSHLRGECTLDEAVEDIVVRTRKFAVRQLRWFRRDPRIAWFDAGGDRSELLGEVERHWRAASVEVPG